MSADNWTNCPRCTAFSQFREDWEIYGADEGAVTVDYRGQCRECGLSLNFEHTVPMDLGSGE